MTIHRIWRSAPGRSAATFNPCMGNPTRFAPLHSAAPSGGGRCIPTMYAGRHFEGAVFETIFRDLPPLPRTRRAFERDFRGSIHTEMKTGRTLRVARLFNQELATVGLSRKTLIESHHPADYLWTVTWAAAFHRDNPDIHGLTWHSRQQDSEQAYIFFGDRVVPADFQIKAEVPLDTGVGRARLAGMANLYQVTLVPFGP